MDQKRIDRALEGLRDADTPSVPGNLRPNVWRRIRQEEPELGGIPLFWPEWLTRPSFFVGMIAASLGIGVLSGTLTSRFHAEPQLGRTALSLNVFTEGSLVTPFPASSPHDN